MAAQAPGNGIVRQAIEITGIVQGVGFRPFVYRLANECNLVGSIANTVAGVSIEVQGPAPAIDAFLNRLPQELPPLAKITSLIHRQAETKADTHFRILSSVREDQTPRVLISPDVAVCEDCLREMNNPRNRRFRYPFINCTNCGPRFTIIRDIPYDRARTSMSRFKMCTACQQEYDDPGNRRFHAQPNACWNCGPQVKLLSISGELIDVAEPIRETARLIEQGNIVAIKGLGGFHLACDAKSEAAVDKLRERKHRVEKPFAIMVRKIEDAEKLCLVDAVARKQLLSRERPIVLLPQRLEGRVATGVAPRNRYLGVFLPYTPLHHLLFSAGKYEALVMTSANLSEEPIVIGNTEALERLKDIADAVLVHDRDILRRCDDSVVRVARGQPQKLRRSRGFVPVPVALEQESPPILAVGGELKNTICVIRGGEAFLSQHVGDLENLESYGFFQEAVEHMQRILEVRPEVLAYDLHPDYFSTKWALEKEGVQRIGVQHHHAHIASCMAENHLDGKVIGLALDGTGYGTDGAIWGGEVLVCGYADFARAAHLRYFPLPGSAAAIHEPWRIALGLLYRNFEKDLSIAEPLLFNDIDPRKQHLVLQIVELGVNSPMTSSCGRLFDAVAALIGIRSTVNYEAQAAIELEMAAHDSSEEGVYPFDLVQEDGKWQIGTRALFASILQDLRKNVSKADISRRFHNGLAAVFAEVAEHVRSSSSLNRVCLSGGCFQNSLLLEALYALLKERGFEVYFHSEVPAGDGGLSLGQALVAAHRVRLTATNGA